MTDRQRPRSSLDGYQEGRIDRCTGLHILCEYPLVPTACKVEPIDILLVPADKASSKAIGTMYNRPDATKLG